MKDGKITIDGKNFKVSFKETQDRMLKKDYIGPSSIIEFNDIYNGSQKLILGDISSNLQNNINNYSRNDNKVVFTGTYVKADGTEIPINKEVVLTVDWYGSMLADCDKVDLSQKSYDLNNAIDNNSGKVKIDLKALIYEKINELIIDKSIVEITIPELNGFKADEVNLVDVSREGITFSYDKENNKLLIENKAEVDSNGYVEDIFNVKNGDRRGCYYKVQVIYPKEAYDLESNQEILLSFPIKSHFEGYNNPDEVYGTHQSSNNIEKIIVRNYCHFIPGDISLEIDVGDHIGHEYIVSKRKPYKIYNGQSVNNNEDSYIVKWGYFTGDIPKSNLIVLREDIDVLACDEIIKTDDSKQTMDNFVSNTGIYFSIMPSIFGENGKIIVYDEETNNVLLTIDNTNALKYTKENPYKYKYPVKHIKIELINILKSEKVNIYNIKNLDDNYIVTNYSRDEFDTFSYISSRVASYDGEEKFLSIGKIVPYQTPYSEAHLKIKENSVKTTEIIENEEITITANYKESYNQEGWNKASYLIKVPDEVLFMDINSVESSKEEVKILSYEYFENENGKFIKVLAQNTVENPVDYNIKINCELVPDSRIPTKTKKFILYAVNGETEKYYNEEKDQYDADEDGNTEELVSFDSSQITFYSPSGLATNETISEFDSTGNVVVSPQIADVEPVLNINSEDKTAKIGVHLINNYNNVTNVVILGKIPFENNKEVFTNSDLASEFSVSMFPEGFEVPESIKDEVNIYYSENENPTKDLSSQENGWKLKEEVTNWENVKSYLIDLGNVVIKNGDTYSFYYKAVVPSGVEYNKVSYGHHGVYFSVITNEGNYPTQTSPYKVGLRIAKKYNLELTKYQKNKGKRIENSVYKITQEDDNVQKTSKTDINGALIFKNLYVEKVYSLNEIMVPDDYELNAEEIKFVAVEENGEIKLNIISGTVKNFEEVQPTGNEGYKIHVDVEDEVKAKLKIIKTNKETGERIPFVFFNINGKEFNNRTVCTNISGETDSISGLFINSEYSISEMRAEGYYGLDNIKFKIINDNENYRVEVTEGSYKNIQVEYENEIPTIIFELENEKIPTYKLIVEKIDKDSRDVKLSNAEFLIKSLDDEKQTKRKTDVNGIFEIDGLYLNVDGKEITGKYTIQESYAPKGYSLNNEEINFVVKKNLDDSLEVEVENKEILTSIKEIEINENTVKIIIQDAPIFKLVKLDKDSLEPIPGVKFIIQENDENEDYAKDINGNYLGSLNEKGQYELVTNENGVISLPLKAGKYKATEIQEVEGYKNSGLISYFRILDNENNEEFYIIDEGEINEVVEINYIEDLIDLSNNIINGETYENKKVLLKRNLDFQDDNCYKNPNDTDTYGDYNKDEIVSSIKNECIDDKGFVPIGWQQPPNSNIYFSGLFDGNGYEIRNLYINNPGYQGTLFGTIKNGMIKNLGVTGTINASYAAGFAGIVENITIVNCYNKCTINGTTGAAGLLTYCYGSSNSGNINIINSYNEGDVYGYEPGGIINKYSINANDIIIKNCYNLGNITSTSSYTGGIVGGYYGYYENLKIDSCYNSGNIICTGSSPYIGGIIGDARSGFVTIENSYNLGNIISPGSPQYVGGIAGQLYNENGYIKNCYNAGNINIPQSTYVGGIIGDIKGKILNCYNTGNITGREYVGGIVGNLSSYSSNPEYFIQSSFNSGTISGLANVGGIVGYGSKIKDVFNEGEIIGKTSNNTHNIGGISGSGSEIENAYNIGKVTLLVDPNTYTGIITGYEYNGIFDNVYYINNSIVYRYNGEEVTEDEIKTREFFEKLNVDGEWIYRENKAPMLKNAYAEQKNITILNVENEHIKYKITTKVEEFNGQKGGTISGEENYPYEEVVYGENSTKEIKMVPNESFKIGKITINGEEQNFIPDVDGSYLLPLFENVKEDKNIVVTYYSLEKNDFIINKVDSNTGEKIPNVTFNIDQIDEREEPISSELIGELTGNGPYYIGADLNSEKSEYLGGMVNNGSYYFRQDEDGSYIPTNGKTWRVKNVSGATTAVSNSTANSYVPIDLRDVQNDYVVVVNAESSFNYSNGWATITETTSAPSLNTYDGRIFRLYMKTDSKDYISMKLEGGKIYYLHFGYKTTNYYSYIAEEDQLKINSIKLYEAKDIKYDFIEEDGKYVSTNQGQDNTVSASYIPIDLTNTSGKIDIMVEAQISSENYYDYGYVAISTDTEIPQSAEKMIYISGENLKTGIKAVESGRIYYLHFVFTKNNSKSEGDDKFTINNIQLSLSEEDIYHTTLKTNNNGKIITQVPYGKYEITEIDAPEDYRKESNPTIINFLENSENEFTIENTKWAKVVAHYYLKEDDGTLTTTKVADDDEYRGEIGEEYKTAPHIDLEKLELQKDESGSYILPENAVGTFVDGILEVNYYYTSEKIPLIVHHYILGTKEKVLLADGEEAEDGISLGEAGISYSTNPILDENLNEKFELVDTPVNAEGIYEFNSVEVTYYYKVKSFKVTTNVEEHEVTDILGNTKNIKGGTISGEGLASYENVKYDEDSEKEIKVVPDEGYEVERITINDEPVDYTPELDGSVILNKFVRMRENKNVVVTFNSLQGTVLVNHYLEGTETRITDLDGAEVAQEVKQGDIGSAYVSKEKEGLENKYDVIGRPAEPSGEFSEQPVELNYYYRIKKYPYVVNFLLKDDDDNDGQIDRTEEVDSSIIIEGHVGEKYKAEEKVFENYELIEDKKPGNAEGTMEIVKDEEGKEITEILVRYYYGTKAEVIEKHIDIKTNKPIEEKTYEGYIGDSYKTEEKQIEGYDIVKNKDIYTAEELENKGLNAEDKYIPENSEGNMENTKTEVDYYYIRKTTIKVEYIDKNTGELITQEIPIEEGHEGDLYETEEKEFEDYKLVIVPEDKEGVMEVEKDEDGNVISTEKVIKYYYVYKSAGVIEKHIDLETGEPIEEEKKYTGYEGDEYEIKPKEIKGYEIVEEKLPENSKGTMDREGIEVIYYYKKVKEETPEPTKEIPEQNTDDGDSNNNLTDSNGRTTIINNNYPTERDRNTDSSSNNTKILATPSYISLDNTNDINNSNNSKFNESKQQEKMVETPSAGDNLPVAVFNIVIALIVLNTLITLVASKNKK